MARMWSVLSRGEIDLHGAYPDDAVQRLVRAIDQAIVEDRPTLRIIHGVGTGALRDRVHAYLADDPRVTRVELEPHNLGTTVVRFE